MSDGPRKVSFTVVTADAGRRLDQVLADRVPGLSRRKARVLLDIGGVFVDRRVRRAQHGRTTRGEPRQQKGASAVLHEGALSWIS